MDGITALQKHLVRVKLEHAEREAALERTVAELKGENDELKAALDVILVVEPLCRRHRAATALKRLGRTADSARQVLDDTPF